MNKFLTFPGIQPVYLGDIDFLQESVRQAFRQLLIGLTGIDTPNCILKEATATADGVICLDGEIMPYKPYTGTMVGIYGYEVVTAYSGARMFKDGESHECYEERYAQQVLGGATRVPTFTELLSQRLRYSMKASNWREGGIQNVFRFVNLGTSVLAELNVEVITAGEYEQLTTDAIVNIPATVASQSPKYCTLTAKSAGSLVAIPAEVTFTAHPGTAQLSYMTVKIPKTTFSAGDKGMLNLNILL